VRTCLPALLWLSAALRDEYTVTVAAPLAITDVEEGWAIKTPVPRTLQLRFRGQGWRLAFLLLGPEIKMTFSYASLNPGKRSITFNDVAERTSSHPGIQLVDVNPEPIIIEVERWNQKKVPIHLSSKLSFKDGYGLVDTVSLQPDSVIIF
jgi:hypothetical protein